MEMRIKQGDTRHAVKAILKDASGNALDLTMATVRFVMATRFGEVLVDREATIQNGQVFFAFEAGETDKEGEMKAEFHVTYQDGRKETFPNDGYMKIEIQKRLGGN